MTPSPSPRSSARSARPTPAPRHGPASPWVFDTRELGRHPGAMRHEQRRVPAPDGLGNEMVGVPAGAPLELDVRLEAVSEGVLVSGTVHVGVAGECARCLEPVAAQLDVPITELFDYEDTRTHRMVEEDDLDPGLVVHDSYVDVGQPVRDEIVLALPLRILCRPDCPGLCPQCGVALAHDPGHHHETMDSRWAALRALTDEKES